jgi:Glycosyltransferase
MKVLHILNELRPSGAETMLRLAAPVWARRGYECGILATGEDKGVYAEALADAGYVVHHLPLQKSPAYFLRLARFIRSEGYTVVHQHAEGARYWFCLSALAAGAKVATTVHNNFQFNGQLRLRRALQRRHLERLGVVFIAIAPGVQKNEESRFGIRPRLIWNWFNTERFHPISTQERRSARSHFGYNEDDKVVVSLGNCSAVKDHSALLQALVGLPDAKYLHIGEEDSAQSERTFANELGVAERVQFTGWLANPRIALASADVYAMPSRYEGFSIAALEAVGSGLPCLLASSPGLVDLAMLHLDLTYAQPESSDLATKLAVMFATIEQLRPAARGNSAKIAKRLSPEVGAVAYADIYEELACSR